MLAWAILIRRFIRPEELDTEIGELVDMEDFSLESFAPFLAKVQSDSIQGPVKLASSFVDSSKADSNALVALPADMTMEYVQFNPSVYDHERVQAIAR